MERAWTIWDYLLGEHRSLNPSFFMFVNYRRFGNTFLIVDLVLDVYDIGVAPAASWIKTLSSCVLNLTQLPLMLKRGFEYINALPYN